jgi:SAM-dependent methyltransferase
MHHHRFYVQSTMSKRPFDKDDPSIEAIGADALAVCEARLGRVAGTHALVVDGMPMAVPSTPGVGCWTTLRPGSGAGRWCGSLDAAVDTLPFGDESFCAVLVRFTQDAGIEPEAVAGEFTRVLAPHGVLLIADFHPRSLWHAGTAPGRWERALRAAGLKVSRTVRCGAPWPRVRGAAGVPHWLVRGMGGAWVVEAQRRTLAAIPLRKAVARRVVETKPVLPGAHRKSLVRQRA